MAKEEYLLKLMGLEQEVNRLEQQMQAVEQHILELQSLQMGLSELESNKEKDIYANFGKNIFLKAQISDKNLLVDVGNKIFVRKNISEAIKLVEEQQAEIMKIKSKILNRIEELQHSMEEIIENAEIKGEENE